MYVTRTFWNRGTYWSPSDTRRDAFTSILQTSCSPAHLDAAHNGGRQRRVVLCAKHSRVHQDKPGRGHDVTLGLSQCLFEHGAKFTTLMWCGWQRGIVSHSYATSVLQMLAAGTKNRPACPPAGAHWGLYSYPMMQERMNWLRKSTSDHPSYSIAWERIKTLNKQAIKI